MANKKRHPSSSRLMSNSKLNFEPPPHMNGHSMVHVEPNRSLFPTDLNDLNDSIKAPDTRFVLDVLHYFRTAAEGPPRGVCGEVGAGGVVLTGGRVFAAVVLLVVLHPLRQHKIEQKTAPPIHVPRTTFV